MIEIRQVDDEPDLFHLVLNGETLQPVSDYFIRDLQGKPEGASVYFVRISEVIFNLIAKCQFYEIPTKLLSIDMSPHLSTPDDNLRLKEICRHKHINHFHLVFYEPLYLKAWKEAYSYDEYLQELDRLVKSTASLHYLYINKESPLFQGTYQITARLESPQLTIGEEIQRSASIINQLLKDAKDSLRSKFRATSVLTYFDLPDYVKVPAEQYLLYFIEFLRDLGVEATAEITQEAGQVLFAVTPNDKETALDKIRVALEVYMRLPSSPIGDGSANDDIAIQKLEGNIYHLKSQLKYAHAEALAHKREILANEREIQAQQTIINYQQHFIDGLIILESAKAVREIEDKEDLLPGVLAVTKYKGNGFEISLAEIMRLLRKFLLE